MKKLLLLLACFVFLGCSGTVEKCQRADNCEVLYIGMGRSVLVIEDKASRSPETAKDQYLEIYEPKLYNVKALAKRIDKYLREHDSEETCKIEIYPGVHDWNISKEQVWALKDLYADHYHVYHDWFNLVFEKKSCLRKEADND